MTGVRALERAPRIRRAQADAMMRTLLAAASAAAVLAAGARPARAGQSSADGAYERFDDDLAFALEVGVNETFPGESLAGRLTTLYLHSAGMYVQYNETFGLGTQALARAMVSGVELRPLFLARFGLDLERGPALLDLFVDSVSIGLGLYGVALSPDACELSGLECWRTGMELAGGVELPLLGRASGPYIGLRGSWRWPARADPPSTTVADEPRGMLGLSLGYRVTALAHAVDAGDEP